MMQDLAGETKPRGENRLGSHQQKATPPASGTRETGANGGVAGDGPWGRPVPKARFNAGRQGAGLTSISALVVGNPFPELGPSPLTLPQVCGRHLKGAGRTRVVRNLHTVQVVGGSRTKLRLVSPAVEASQR